MNKEYFEKRKKALEEKRAKLVKRAQESEDVNEVRAINDELLDIANELHDVADILADMAKGEDEGGRRPNDDDVDVDVDDRPARSGFNPNKAVNVASVKMNGGVDAKRSDDPRGTMEYRNAFKEYVIRGTVSPVLQFEKRENQVGVAADLGVLLPTTVIQEIIGGVEKVYGQLYARVKKTNIKGGVKYPIGSFNATFKRITETTVSDRQRAGGITGYVEFSYNIGEIRIARTLLQDVLSVPVFEREIAKVIVEAYVKAMDVEIMLGDPAKNEMAGILTEANKVSGSRIAADHIIEFTADEMADWKTWRKKVFAVVPLSMRNMRPEFAMTANTYESNIKTLADDNNRPVYAETYNPIDGDLTARFYGREVVFVEDDILKNFDDAANGEYFGLFWVPDRAYAINTNLEFTMVRYFDQETNQYVDKALVINDGKILDPKYLYLLKKKVSA
jgi:HK97 family phage major capsid protein